MRENEDCALSFGDWPEPLEDQEFGTIPIEAEREDMSGIRAKFDPREDREFAAFRKLSQVNRIPEGVVFREADPIEPK